MTDKEKLEKIVAYLMRRMYAHNQMADIGSTGEIFDEKIENAKYEECKDLLNFIDSMQKEPKECMYSKDNYTDEDRKVLCEGCEEECKFNKKEEPASEDLEKAIDTYLKSYWGGEKEKQDWPFLKKMAIHFAEWHKQKDSIPVSEDLEEAAIQFATDTETGKVDIVKQSSFFWGAIYHRQQMMAKAIKATIEEPEPLLWRVLGELEGLFVAENNLHDGDGVKVIIIKEE